MSKNTGQHDCLLCNGFNPDCPAAPRKCSECQQPLAASAQKNRDTCSDLCRKHKQRRLEKPGRVSKIGRPLSDY